MSDRQGILCLLLHLVGYAAAIVGASTGTWELMIVGMIVYLGCGALVIRYIAE